MKTLRISSFASFALGAAALAGLLFTGCMSEPSKSDESHITLKMGVSDMDNLAKTGLRKGSTIKLKKLVITLTSSFAGDSVIRDTIIASDSVGSKFKTTSTDSQSFSKPYAIKPLRSWTVSVKTLDTRDSVVHSEQVIALNLLAGETRSVTLNLSARYVMYQVKFLVPDSLRSSLTGQAQKITITRFVMKVDSAIAIDSSSIAGFAAKPVVHTADFDYIRVNTTPTVTIRFYGHSAGTNDTLLFEKVIPNVNPETEQPPVNAVYVGPGANGFGGAINNLIINIGKVNTIVFNTNVNETITVKRAAQ